MPVSAYVQLGLCSVLPLQPCGGTLQGAIFSDRLSVAG